MRPVPFRSGLLGVRLLVGGLTAIASAGVGAGRLLEVISGTSSLLSETRQLGNRIQLPTPCSTCLKGKHHSVPTTHMDYNPDLNVQPEDSSNLERVRLAFKYFHTKFLYFGSAFLVPVIFAYGFHEAAGLLVRSSLRGVAYILCVQLCSLAHCTSSVVWMVSLRTQFYFRRLDRAHLRHRVRRDLFRRPRERSQTAGAALPCLGVIRQTPVESTHRSQITRYRNYMSLAVIMFTMMVVTIMVPTVPVMMFAITTVSVMSSVSIAVVVMPIIAVIAAMSLVTAIVAIISIVPGVVSLVVLGVRCRLQDGHSIPLLRPVSDTHIYLG